jgi:3-methyladenine DNA glycosylase/8-oxoguanine DNA glycosylase
MISREIENGILHIYKNDPSLARIIDISSTCSLKPKRNHYLIFLRSIINQQLSAQAASSIYKRFLIYFNNKPLPEKIIIAPDIDLRNIGLSNAKVRYIKDFSEKIINGEIHFRGLGRKSDSEIIEEFTKVKGIGEWTVQMFLIFNLCRLDILPVKDQGIKRGAMIAYNLKKLPDEKKLLKLSHQNKWTPYKSIASWYLWMALEL